VWKYKCRLTAVVVWWSCSVVLKEDKWIYFCHNQLYVLNHDQFPLH